MSRTAAVLDSPQTSEGQAWRFLDTLVVEHRWHPARPVVLEMTLPAARSAPAPAPRPGRQLVPAGRADGGAMRGPDAAARPATGCPAARGTARLPGGGHQPARILLVHDNDSFLSSYGPGQPAAPGNCPATGGPGLRSCPGAGRVRRDRSWIVAEQQEAQAFMAEHG